MWSAAPRIGADLPHHGGQVLWMDHAVAQILEDWLPQVILCLFLQGALIGGARVLDQLTPDVPLCSAPRLAL